MNRKESHGKLFSLLPFLFFYFIFFLFFIFNFTVHFHFF